LIGAQTSSESTIDRLREGLVWLREAAMKQWVTESAKLIRKVTVVAGEVPKEGASRWTLPVYTLTFENPGQDKTMPSLGCRIDRGDVVKVLIPGYKPKSYSMSAARPGEFDLTVKVYPGGKCSGYLDSVKVGETVEVFAKGKKERRPGGSHVGLVAFGVGITEALPIAAAELQKGVHEVHLLWAARTYADMFWHDEIAELQAAHEAFKVTRILSREDREGCLRGRVEARVLEDVFGSWKGNPQARFLTVGTKEMMRQAEATLTRVGFPWPDCALLAK